MDSSLATYLRSAKRAYCGDGDGKVDIVLGNQSADMDSIVCSIVGSLWLSSNHPGILPVVNVPRADMVLRPDVCALLESVNVESEELTFVDEVDLQALHDCKRLSLHLVDHNELATEQASLEDAVVRIVDHHEDAKKSPHVKGDLRRIEMVGSCASLIGDCLLKDQVDAVTSDVARLLLGPILIDCVNLDDSAGKVTPFDKGIVETLSGIAFAARDDRAKARGEFYADMRNAKFTNAGMTPSDIFRRDYKEFSFKGGYKVGVAAVLACAQKWATDEGPKLLHHFEDFRAKRDLHVLVTMHVYPRASSVGRQTMIFSSLAKFGRAKHAALVAFLANHAVHKVDFSPLKLPPLDIPKDTAFEAFDQRNIQPSRKQYKPMLDDFFNQLE